MASNFQIKRKSSTPCYFFNQRRCRYSDENCHFAHVIDAEDDCHFAHVIDPEDESHVVARLGHFIFPPASDSMVHTNTFKSNHDSSLSVFNKNKSGDRKEHTFRGYRQNFSNAETRVFSSVSTWDMKKLDEGGIKKVVFGPDFNVDDTHLAAICCRPDLASSLVSLSLGDSDTGYGARLTDHGVILLARTCRNMRKLNLEAATSLTDQAFLTICEACPSIKSLSITGNDKVRGRLTNASLQKLIDCPQIAPKLRQLELCGQIYMKNVKVLSSARRKLIIKTGQTLGDRPAANIAAAMSGGVQTRTWLAGMVVNAHTDSGRAGYEMMDSLGWEVDPWLGFGDFDGEGDWETDQETEGDEDESRPKDMEDVEYGESEGMEVDK